MMDTYLKIKKNFDDNGCKLLTTYEEYQEYKKNNLEKNYGNIRVNFVAKCTHKNNVAITNFISRKTGLICKNCRYEQYKILNKNNNASNIELEGNKILEKHISENYIIKKTIEGCSADLLIKDINSNDNLYIPVQMKSTLKKSHNIYSFKKIKSSYKNMLLILICITEEKIWIIPYNDIDRCMKNLSISNKSKYNKYEVASSSLPEVIKKYNCLSIKEELINIPQTNSIYQIREREYINKRENMINFLNYVYPDIHNTRTDFIINNKKIQEKVVGFRKNRNAYSVWLSTNYGKKENGNRKYRSYKLGENDYYWFNSSIDDKFWIIPELILYENNMISNKDDVINRKCIYFQILESENYSNHKWLKNYEYNYNNIDKIKILNMFL